jgi:dTDP-4-amino-4,6-dideoxygalactose transaminase
MSGAMTGGGAPAIPFIDMAAVGQALDERLAPRLAEALRSGRFILGPEVEELERRLAAFSGAAAAVGVNSGTDALTIALMAREIGPGDAVFVPAFSFVATAGAALTLGATPVFVDVDPDDMTLDPAHLRRQIAEVRRAGELRPAAVIPVDLFGAPARYDEIAPLAEEEGLVLIADAAQSFGATQGGRQVGSLAPLTAVSFYPTKPLGCFGDGGAILTRDPQEAAICAEIRQHGFDRGRTTILRHGLNSRLDTLQAAVLLARLEIFPDELARRRKIAGWYGEALKGRVGLQRVSEDSESNWAIYAIRSARREALRAGLAEAGIGSAVYYAKAIHDYPLYAAHGARSGPLPHTARLCGDVLALPMHPYLTREMVERVCGEVLRILS